MVHPALLSISMHEMEAAPMREKSPTNRSGRFGTRMRRLSLGALLLAAGAQGVFVFTRATAILVDGVAEAVTKVLS